MAAIVRKLPFGLAEILPPSLVGFAVINGFTFAVDLGVLTTLRSELRWPPGKPFLNAVDVVHSYAANRAMDRLTWLVKN